MEKDRKRPVTIGARRARKNRKKLKQFLSLDLSKSWSNSRSTQQTKFKIRTTRDLDLIQINLTGTRIPPLLPAKTMGILSIR